MGKEYIGVWGDTIEIEHSNEQHDCNNYLNLYACNKKIDLYVCSKCGKEIELPCIYLKGE